MMIIYYIIYDEKRDKQNFFLAIGQIVGQKKLSKNSNSSDFEKLVKQIKVAE
jgi:hypothetical protein